MDSRLTELETKATFQDQSLEELQQMIAEQQQQLEAFQRRLKKLEKELGVAMEDGQMPDIIDVQMEVPPPHY